MNTLLDPDKRKHFWAMLTGTIVAAVLTRNAWIAGTIAMFLGVMKELYDYYIGTTGFSIDDMVMNSLGIFLAMPIFIGAQAVEREINKKEEK